MEEVLTLDELYLLVEKAREEEHRQNRFLAALQGVDLDEGKTDEAFERVKQKAAADLAGKSEEEYVFDLIGIEVEPDDD